MLFQSIWAMLKESVRNIKIVIIPIALTRESLEKFQRKLANVP